jgi:hypothetical protein
MVYNTCILTIEKIMITTNRQQLTTILPTVKFTSWCGGHMSANNDYIRSRSLM